MLLESCTGAKVEILDDRIEFSVSDCKKKVQIWNFIDVEDIIKRRFTFQPRLAMSAYRYDIYDSGDVNILKVHGRICESVAQIELLFKASFDEKYPPK